MRAGLERELLVAGRAHRHRARKRRRAAECGTRRRPRSPPVLSSGSADSDLQPVQQRRGRERLAENHRCRSGCRAARSAIGSAPPKTWNAAERAARSPSRARASNVVRVAREVCRVERRHDELTDLVVERHLLERVLDPLGGDLVERLGQRRLRRRRRDSQREHAAKSAGRQTARNIRQ